MTTYQNQKVIHINKIPCKVDFLQIQNDLWMEAARELSGAAFKLYMYLASNSDGFDLALSRVDVTESVGIGYSAYDKAVAQLLEKGYLNLRQGNIYDFTTYPLLENKRGSIENQERVY